MFGVGEDVGVRPMLASKGTFVPRGEEWVHEVKWDGVRALTDVLDGRLRMYSRNGNDITVAWPELSTSPLGERDLLVDGEIIALNDAGLPDFRMLQDRMHLRNAQSARRLSVSIPATYMVFDLLRLDGEDLARLSWEERRARLEALAIDSTWQVPAAYDDGPMLYDATLQQGLEGVVSKRRKSTYHFDRRTDSWLKLAHRLNASFVIGGWKPQEGTAVGPPATVLVGEMTADGLLYRGRVGSGIGPKAGARLLPMLQPLQRADSPFDDEVPKADVIGVTFVDPVIVIDVDSHATAKNQRLRQPSFRGVRSDLSPEDLLR
jgi:bifunctional non-homologous end joining protein LigD